MELFFRIAYGCAWGGLVLVWAAGWRISKPTSRSVEGLNRLTPFLPVLIGVALLQMQVLPGSWIKEPLWPHSLVLDAAGLSVTVLGAVFAIWSRVTYAADQAAKDVSRTLCGLSTTSASRQSFGR